MSDYYKQENDILVDLRDKVTYSFGSINGAVNIPVDEIDRLYTLPKDKRIVLFCQSGDSSAEIAALLSELDYNIADLSGGYREYVKTKLLSEDSENNLITGDKNE